MTTPTVYELRALLREALRVTPSGYLILPALCSFDDSDPSMRRAIADRLRVIIEVHQVTDRAA